MQLPPRHQDVKWIEIWHPSDSTWQFEIYIYIYMNFECETKIYKTVGWLSHHQLWFSPGNDFYANGLWIPKNMINILIFWTFDIFIVNHIEFIQKLNELALCLLPFYFIVLILGQLYKNRKTRKVCRIGPGCFQRPSWK